MQLVLVLHDGVNNTTAYLHTMLSKKIRTRSPLKYSKMVYTFNERIYLYNFKHNIVESSIECGSNSNSGFYLANGEIAVGGVNIEAYNFDTSTKRTIAQKNNGV